jgi:hypothetical protein
MQESGRWGDLTRKYCLGTPVARGPISRFGASARRSKGGCRRLGYDDHPQSTLVELCRASGLAFPILAKPWSLTEPK